MNEAGRSPKWKIIAILKEMDLSFQMILRNNELSSFLANFRHLKPPCNATELRLMPAWPLVKVRLMDDIRRRLWLPSRPATDPDKEVIGPRVVRKRSDIAGLLDSWMRNK